MTECSVDAASTKLARAEVGRPGLQTEANSTDFSLRPSLRLFMAQERVENPRLHILLVHTADKFLSASAFGGKTSFCQRRNSGDQLSAGHRHKDPIPEVIIARTLHGGSHHARRHDPGTSAHQTFSPSSPIRRPDDAALTPPASTDSAAVLLPVYVLRLSPGHSLR